MGALTIWEYLILAALIWLILSNRSRRGGHGHSTTILNSYVITHWSVRDGEARGNLIDIRGRRAGLISYFLHTVGIDPKISLLVDRHNVCVEEGSLNGFMRESVPITRIAAGIHGYSKPWKRAVGLTAVLLFLIYLISSIALSKAAASILVFLAPAGGWIYYKLHKSLVVAVETTGGGVLGLSFMPSVIEGISVDEEQAAKVIHIIEKLMFAPPAPSLPAAEISELPAIDQTIELPQTPLSAAPKTTDPAICEFCPECGQRNDDHLSACKYCGATFAHS